MTNSPVQTHCLTLVPDGTPISPLLQSLLRDRGWSLLVRHHVIDAMADLCLGERLERNRSGWGLVRAIRTVLLIVCPSQWSAPDIAALERALRRYLPDVGVATFERGRISEPAVVRARPVAATEPRPEPTSLRMNGDARPAITAVPAPHVATPAQGEACDGHGRPRWTGAVDRLEAQRRRTARRAATLEASATADTPAAMFPRREPWVTQEELAMLLGSD